MRALADRENGRPSAPPISAPAVGPLSARRVAAGPSVDEYRAGQENSTNMASWTDEAGAHRGEPERERPVSLAPNQKKPPVEPIFPIDRSIPVAP